MDALHTIDIPYILALSPAVDEYSLGEDFILGEMRGPRARQSRAVMELLRYPLRFDGYILFFLRKGSLQLEMNLGRYEVGERSMFLHVPGNMVRVSSLSEDADLVFALISKEFMHSLRMNFREVFQEGIRLWNAPCVSLGEEDLQVLESYFSLIRDILSSGLLRGKREVLGPLVASLSCFSMEVWMRALVAARGAALPASPRQDWLFSRFLSLVTEYHASERGMAFYADKMGLTPKYLSKLIKQSTGRSAPYWIDAFVILEAKNLLKHSDKSIKEIVYSLHFPNQSVFYKYFKSHTGLTPSQYRKG